MDEQQSVDRTAYALLQVMQKDFTTLLLAVMGRSMDAICLGPYSYSVLFQVALCSLFTSCFWLMFLFSENNEFVCKNAGH